MPKRKTELADEHGEAPRAPGLDPSARDVLAAILDTAGALIAVLDAQGTILIWNRTCEELTGVCSGEAVGRRLWEVANPAHEADSVRAFYFELIARGFPETHERHWTAKSGERRLIKWSNTAIRNAQGGIEFVVATGFDITESRKAKIELEVRGHQLGERVKELACLYGISRLGERQPLDLDEFLQAVAELIPPAWQYPDICSAVIAIGDRTYSCGDPARGRHEMRRQIMLNGEGAGEIVVGYSENPGGGEPFLPEEYSLLDSISAAVGRIVLNYRASRRIVEYQERLRSLASELALTGERERRRIAQQLHNEIGHTMAGIKFRLSELAKERRDPWIADLIKLTDGTIDAARNITFELCPPVLHELGLGAALEWVTHQLESNYGIPCYFHDDRSPKPLSEDVRVEIFQAVREFLVNIGKHSKASRASVNVSAEGGMLQICVCDNGVGFDAREGNHSGKGASGWGLFGARERLSHLGAEVKIESAPGKGTKISLATPLAAENAAAAANSGVARDVAHVPLAPVREPIKIMIVDDQQLTRAGFKSLLEKESEFRVVAEASDGKEAIEKARELRPDVVVMDVAMPGMSGIEATRRILAEEPAIRVIGLSMHADGQFVVEMLRAGATGYLLKDCAQDDLSQAIRVVHANLTFLSPGLTDRVAMKYVSGGAGREGADEVPRETKIAGLTKREKEVLRHLAEGLNTKQIAARLKISAKTVETHRAHVMEKLNERSVAGLTRLAIAEGLVSAD